MRGGMREGGKERDEGRMRFFFRLLDHLFPALSLLTSVSLHSVSAS